MRRAVLAAVWLVYAALAWTQEARLLLKDAQTGDVIPYAHILIESLDGRDQHLVVTNAAGYAPNVATRPSRLKVSCVGYVNYLDTIVPGNSHTLLIRPAVLDMDAVVVTAQYTPRQADRSLYPVRVISTAKINSKAATNLRELLSDELSMRLSQDGALGSHLSLRGLSGEHIKFLIDGVPVIGRMNGNIDLGQLNLHNVEHVEVIEGPMSVIYGSNALAGVVNIITRESMPDQWRSSLETYYESVGTYNASMAASYSRKRHGLSMNLARNFFSGWSPEDTSRAKLWKPKRQYDGEVTYSYRMGDFRLKAAMRYFHELLLNKGALLPPYYETAFDAYFFTQRYTARVEATYPLGEWIKLEGMTAWSGYNREKETMFKDLTTLQQVKSGNDEDQDTTSFQSFMARLVTIHADPGATLEYKLGVDVNMEMGTGKRITDQRQQIGDYAAFTSIKYQPFETLELQPGLRYGYNSRYKHPLIWSMHGKWRAAETLTVRASYSRGFRAPALKELYLYFVDINHNIQGNPELEAEYSANANISASLNGHKGKLDWSAELNLFDNRIRNIITLAQSGQSLYTYINVDQYNTRGAELKLQAALYPWVSIKPGLSFTGRSSAIGSTAENATQLRYATDFNTSLSLKPFGPAWEVSAFYKYVGKLPQLYLDNTGELREGFIDDYHILDASLSRTLLKRQLSLAAGVKNVLNNTAIDIMGGTGGVHGGSGGSHLAGYGRTWFLKLNWTLNRINKN